MKSKRKDFSIIAKVDLTVSRELITKSEKHVLLVSKEYIDSKQLK